MKFKFQKLPCINNVSYLGYDEYGESILMENIVVYHLRKFQSATCQSIFVRFTFS